MPRFTDIGSYVDGMPTKDARGYLVLSIDALAQQHVPHCVVITWEAGQFLSATQKGWSLARLARLPPDADERALFIGSHGLALVKERTAERDTRVSGPDIEIGHRGPLRAARTIADSVYVVGGDRQAYRLPPDGGWHSLDAGLRPQNDEGATVSLEAIDGFAADEIYAVGLLGEIWLYDGNRWSGMASPTRWALSALCCAGDGWVYAAGPQGLLLRGRHGTWETLDVGTFPYDVLDLCWFQGSLHVATQHRVHRLDGNVLVALDAGVQSAGRLACHGNVLWSIGAKDVAAFDGYAWTRID